ncbi:MAG: hypothetical protein Edafosvirus9_23 [Edafosvirus sp.]|uniref:Uncharacterized protein n=1 Tax=Edafosvirus sp. TaxID=2487765 RepID=A0A3G4ZY39_9VIRU|nr:MAG: hypothetical protein Edafosvirus9_23 [Edafosvirus sp.]
MYPNAIYLTYQYFKSVFICIDKQINNISTFKEMTLAHE